MKILAILRPAGDVRSAIATRARQELDALWEQYRDGRVREIYSPGGPGAVLILEAESRLEAGSALERLPLVAEKIVSVELIELHPFTAFEMLFSRR